MEGCAVCSSLEQSGVMHNAVRQPRTEAHTQSFTFLFTYPRNWSLKCSLMVSWLARAASWGNSPVPSFHLLQTTGSGIRTLMLFPWIYALSLFGEMSQALPTYESSLRGRDSAVQLCLKRTEHTRPLRPARRLPSSDQSKRSTQTPGAAQSLALLALGAAETLHPRSRRWSQRSCRGKQHFLHIKGDMSIPSVPWSFSLN